MVGALSGGVLSNVEVICDFARVNTSSILAILHMGDIGVISKFPCFLSKLSGIFIAIYSQLFAFACNLLNKQLNIFCNKEQRRYSRWQALTRAVQRSRSQDRIGFPRREELCDRTSKIEIWVPLSSTQLCYYLNIFLTKGQELQESQCQQRSVCFTAAKQGKLPM